MQFVSREGNFNTGSKSILGWKGNLIRIIMRSLSCECLACVSEKDFVAVVE